MNTSQKTKATRIAKTAALSAALLSAACGKKNDAAVLNSSTQDPTTASANTTTLTTRTTVNKSNSATTGDAQNATQQTTTKTTETTTEQTTTKTTDATQATAQSVQLKVDFTFEASSGFGPVRNPYVAVWVEDSNGNLVDTLAAWYEHSGKGLRYLNHLRNWYSSSMNTDTSMTSATRAPGSYSLAWDGTTVDGQKLSAGTYTIFIEAAREHGSYELVYGTFNVDGSSSQQTLTPNGEITSATITVSA